MSRCYVSLSSINVTLVNKTANTENKYLYLHITFSFPENDLSKAQRWLFFTIRTS